MRSSDKGSAHPTCTIAVVGGGFTGAMLCSRLLRQSPGNLSIVLIEREVLPGRGVAYGTKIDRHLLNVRANNMSAHPDQPDHFVKWAQCNYSAAVRPEDFLPRPLYGEYIIDQLLEARGANPGKLHHIQDEVVSLSHAGGAAKIRLAGGQVITATKVVLALGHFPPGNLPFLGKTNQSARYLSNPWSPTPTDVAQDKNVLLIGSGLTSVDTIIELRAKGFQGTIHILSRHGLLPKSHNSSTPFPPFWNQDSPKTARGLLREVRRQVELSEANGADWRSVIDSLRPVTQEVWRSLPLVEQRRFLRHLRTYWDVHRHRIAERIAEQMAAQIRSGHIQMHAGRVTECREEGGGVEISYRDRKSGEIRALRVDRVVNCTGPDSDYRRVASPLLSDLMDQGLVRPDPLALGLDVADDGALLDAEGVPSDFLYTLGPLRKGGLWESIAVPELRVQIYDLAERLLNSCKSSGIESEHGAAGVELSTSVV